LPELVRADLQPGFKNVSTIQDFWDFTNHTLGPSLFFNENMIDGKEMNWEKLNLYDNDTHTDPSRGRFFVGPVRFLAQRVKKKECLRASNVQRYQRYFKNCYEI
jgi:hypothetical protein